MSTPARMLQSRSNSPPRSFTAAKRAPGEAVRGHTKPYEKRKPKEAEGGASGPTTGASSLAAGNVGASIPVAHGAVGLRAFAAVAAAAVASAAGGGGAHCPVGRSARCVLHAPPFPPAPKAQSPQRRLGPCGHTQLVILRRGCRRTTDATVASLGLVHSCHERARQSWGSGVAAQALLSTRCSVFFAPGTHVDMVIGRIDVARTVDGIADADFDPHPRMYPGHLVRFRD